MCLMRINALLDAGFRRHDGIVITAVIFNKLLDFRAHRPAVYPTLAGRQTAKLTRADGAIASVDFDVAILHHLRPLGDVPGDHAPELLEVGNES